MPQNILSFLISHLKFKGSCHQKLYEYIIQFYETNNVGTATGIFDISDIVSEITEEIVFEQQPF